MRLVAGPMPCKRCRTLVALVEAPADYPMPRLRIVDHVGHRLHQCRVAA